MNNYEGEWARGRIALVLIILIVLAFSVYYLFFQPDGIEPTKPIPVTSECDPFPAEIDEYGCVGIEEGVMMERYSLTVCREYDEEGNCTDQIRILPKETYLVSYMKKGRASLRYFLITFEEAHDAEGLFEEKLELFEDACLDASKSEGMHRECVNVSVDGDKGFYLNEGRTLRYRRFLLSLNGDSFILVMNDCTYEEDILNLPELKKLILEFKGKTRGARK